MDQDFANSEPPRTMNIVDWYAMMRERVRRIEERRLELEEHDRRRGEIHGYDL